MPERRPLTQNEVHEWTAASLHVLAIHSVQRSGDSTPAIDRLYVELWRATGEHDVSNKATRAAVKRAIVRQAKLALANLRSKTNA
jgi:hypothetical protein